MQLPKHPIPFILQTVCGPLLHFSKGIWIEPANTYNKVKKDMLTLGAPSISGRGGGQDRVRGRHLTAKYTTGGGGTVHFQPIQPVGGRG